MIKISNRKELSSAFIIPYYVNEYELQEQGKKKKKKLLIADTIEGLFLQTDEDWSAIIVVDMPPNEETHDYLIQLKQKHYPKIDVIFLERNVGPGVRIQFAYQCPFPNEKASEDFHSWIRMSAFGANFKYTSLIPTKYRIPSFMKYQASRTRIGPSNFNQIKVRVDSDGFSKATEIALARNIIKPEEIPMIKAKFYKRLAKSMRREMENRLANELLIKAAQLEYESFVYFNK